MTTNNIAKEERDEKTKIDEGKFVENIYEEDMNRNSAMIPKTENIETCKMFTGNVSKEVFVKSCAKPQNLEGLFAKGEPPFKEYMEEESYVVNEEYSEMEPVKQLPLTIIVTHLDQVIYFFVEVDLLAPRSCILLA